MKQGKGKGVTSGLGDDAVEKVVREGLSERVII
jgi:hypothetical protein